MNWVYKKRLKQLLLRATSHGQDEILQLACHAAFQSKLSTYMGGGKVPTKNILEIYERRSKSKLSSARGFESLLISLKATDDKHVRLHSFMVDGNDFIVFTDTVTSRLLGILIIDVRKQLAAGWFDKNGKWKRFPNSNSGDILS